MKGGGESLQRGDGHDLTLSGRTLPQSGSRIARFRISWAVPLSPGGQCLQGLGPGICMRARPESSSCTP